MACKCNPRDKARAISKAERPSQEAIVRWRPPRDAPPCMLVSIGTAQPKASLLSGQDLVAIRRQLLWHVPLTLSWDRRSWCHASHGGAARPCISLPSCWLAVQHVARRSPRDHLFVHACTPYMRHQSVTIVSPEATMPAMQGLLCHPRKWQFEAVLCMLEQKMLPTAEWISDSMPQAEVQSNPSIPWRPSLADQIKVLDKALMS
ncbi:hypothetical protein V8C37DRAFT_372018 [Trichoderma ceciliae]